MMHEKNIKQALAQWQIEPLTDEMQERIIRRALTQPQRLTWAKRFTMMMEEYCSRWQAGLAAKLAILALCALLGGVTGMYQQQRGIDAGHLAFGETEWVGEI